ncbi:MAG: cation:proton antiporter [Bacteroidales bacterium]|nr:cation:proton antiporter [Bacteroidales bacterium]
MTNEYMLIVLTGLIIFSYLFDIFAKKTRFPSVFLLLLLGVGLNVLTAYFEIETFDFLQILPALGTVGLILIVLEGSLDLKYETAKRKVIRKAFLSALFLLLITSLSIALLFYFATYETFSICILNAIPFGVVSSAIAIPSVANIEHNKKEFIIYESSFSDILGIVFFNYALTNSDFGFSSFLNLTFDVILVVLISVVFSVFLLFLLGRIYHSVKFFLIISILILVYATGEYFHLSSLIIVLVFGLFINNADQIRYPFFRKFFIYEKLQYDLHQLFQLSAESAFLVKTFFFIIFGFTISLSALTNPTNLLYALIVIFIIYLIRFVYLKWIARTEMVPELYISPRGLISILLFYNIPLEQRLQGMESGILFVVILVTSIIMSIGLVQAGKTVGAQDSRLVSK